jgi:hypothetical protein
MTSPNFEIPHENDLPEDAETVVWADGPADYTVKPSRRKVSEQERELNALFIAYTEQLQAELAARKKVPNSDKPNGSPPRDA